MGMGTAEKTSGLSSLSLLNMIHRVSSPLAMRSHCLWFYEITWSGGSRYKVEMKPSHGFSTIGPNNNENGRFSSRRLTRHLLLPCSNRYKRGKARSQRDRREASDAISRSITVRPNGEEKAVSVSPGF